MQMALLFIDRECRFDKICDQARVQPCDQSCNQVHVQACEQARDQACDQACVQARVQACDQTCEQARDQACDQARVQSCNQLSDRTCDLTKGPKALCETLREDLRWLVNFVEPLVQRPVSATLRKG